MTELVEQVRVYRCEYCAAEVTLDDEYFVGVESGLARCSKDSVQVHGVAWSTKSHRQMEVTF